MLQRIQWAIGVDPEVITKSFTGVQIEPLLEKLISMHYITISTSLDAPDDVIYLKQRRLVSKVMTILIRDYHSVETVFPSSKALQTKHMMDQVQELTIANLTYLLPFYQRDILYATPETSRDIEDLDL